MVPSRAAAILAACRDSRREAVAGLQGGASMARILAAWLLVLLASASAGAQARTLQARIARVESAVATLQRVQVRLDWPAGASEGLLTLRAASADAPDLGYRWRGLTWRCPLRRDGHGGWRCDGTIAAATGGPLRLALALGPASTDAVLARGESRIALRRSAATPELTTLDLARVPVAWSQALLAQAWAEGRLKQGTLDGRLDVHTPADRPLRVAGTLQARGVALENGDASIAAENLGLRATLDYRSTPALALVSLDARLQGGELLFGNTYLALPATPVTLRIDGRRDAGQGWRLPAIAWGDGSTLAAEGSAAFDRDGALRDLDLSARSDDLQALPQRYLSGQLALFGLGEATLSGAADLHVAAEAGRLARFDAHLRNASLRDPADRFAFDGLDGEIRYRTRGQADSTLAWRGGTLYGLAFGPAALPLRSDEGALRFRAPVTLPMLGGSLRFEDVALRPPSGEAGLDLRFALQVDGVDVGQVSKALGLPAFQGTLGGRIPRARYANERLDFDGGLSMQLFDGRVEFSSLVLERPFGSAPSLGADIAMQDLDLLRLTEVLDVGSITGRLDGDVRGLRLVDWTPVAFDARFRSDPQAARRNGSRQRISQRAVQDISSVGDASFVTSLQGRLIGLFDDFGYARIGIGCRLSNQVCRMSGLEGAGSESNAFTIVRGARIPRLDVVGYNRDVDWPTLVERIAAVGKGDVKPVVE
jgi:hypothetical protein